MTISEFAALTGLSISTIRYYDKLGLLPGLKRDSSGYRAFDEGDVEWVRFINRLKQTGMSIRDIVRYSDLREQGDSTIRERISILTGHQQQLELNVRKELEHLENIRAKIEIYRKRLPSS